MELIEVGGIHHRGEDKDCQAPPGTEQSWRTTGLTSRKRRLASQRLPLECIIEHYTRESGVRQLKKQINKSLRKVAYKLTCDQAS